MPYRPIRCSSKDSRFLKSVELETDESATPSTSAAASSSQPTHSSAPKSISHRKQPSGASGKSKGPLISDSIPRGRAEPRPPTFLKPAGVDIPSAPKPSSKKRSSPSVMELDEPPSRPGPSSSRKHNTSAATGSVQGQSNSPKKKKKRNNYPISHPS